MTGRDTTTPPGFAPSRSTTCEACRAELVATYRLVADRNAVDACAGCAATHLATPAGVVS